MGPPLLIAAIAFTAVSIVYTVQQQRKAKKAAEAARRAAEEARKGFEIAVEGEAISLPVVYGRTFIAGAKVFHDIKSNYTHANIVSGNIEFQSNMGSSKSGEKNEFLFIQQAVCYGPIHNVIDWRLDDQPSDLPELAYGQRINFYKSGGIADPMMAANFSSRGTAVFTDAAYASMVFRLNRDEPQYQGPPNVGFYIEGKLVRDIVKSGDNYSLADYSYSNNPALCLLDYLLDSKYGRGLSLGSIDLESFYNSKVICSSIVQQNVGVSGRIWSKRGIFVRALPLYECNIVLNTEKPIRDNITEILFTMGDADLVWSGGKYKLQLQYPQGIGDILLGGVLTDDDIVRSSLTVEYPSANDRMNFCTIKFSDEATDFKENTASWPPKGSSIYNTLLAQDNNVPLENSFNESGIVDYYHALAKAEELVRLSRSTATYSFKVNLKNTFYEPGDIVLVNSSIAAINNEYLKVREVKVNSDSTAEIVATKFDPAQLAWNAKDDQIVPVRNTYDFQIQPPLGNSVIFTPSSSSSVTGGIGILSWSPPLDQTPASYIIEYRKLPDVLFTSLGTSSSTTFEVFSLTAGRYQFAVRSRSTFGQLSSRSFSGLIDINDGTLFAPIKTTYDKIVLSAGKVITNLYIQINTPQIGGFINAYEVDVRLKDETDWISLGIASNSLFEYPNVIDGRTYEIRSRVINKVGATSPYSFGTHNVVGKLAPPSNVTNFFYTISNNSLNFKWDPIPDLDADLYEVRYGINWEDSILVVRTKENFYELNNPVEGTLTYFIKAVDTTGNYSLEKSFVEVEISAPSAVSLNSSFSGENYILSWNVPQSQLSVEEYIIEKDEIEIARAKTTIFSSKADWVGLKEFSVMAVDSAGNIGPRTNTSLFVSVAPPTSINVQVIDNNVLLSWLPVQGSLPTIGYEIRRGSSWEFGQVVGLIYSEFATIFEIESGIYNYWIAAKDSAGNYGAIASISASVSEPPDFVLALNYDSPFEGTRVNAVEDADKGIILPVDPTRTWTDQFTTQNWDNIQDAIDRGLEAFILPGVSSGSYEEIVDYGLTLGSMKVTVLPTITEVGTDLSYSFTISLSDDNITYIDYEDTFEVFGTSFRYIKIRLDVSSSSQDSVLRLERLRLILSAKEKSDSGTVEVSASDTSGTVVYFNQDFLDIESIVLTPRGTAAAIAIYDFVDVPNPTFFSIYLFNPITGQRISGTVSWSATGF